MPTIEKNPILLPDHSPWGIAVIEPGSGRILAANRCIETVYNCHKSERLTDVFSLSAEEPLALIIESLAAGQKWNGRLYTRANKRGISSVEVFFERPSEQPEHIWLYTLEHPWVNEQLRFSSRSELKMLRVILDNTLEYVFFRDLEGSIILSNAAFSSAVAVGGRMPSVDTKIEDFVSPKSAAWINSIDSRMLETGRPVVNEVALFILKNGTKHWLQLTTVPVRSGEGVIIGSLSVARDISDLKRTESELRAAIAQAHQASRAKGDFLATMSHEIRTPINGIIGASELCRETRLDVEQRSYMDIIIQCSSTLLSLVNDVLDFSKIEAGHLKLESLNFSPRSLIESVFGEFAPAAQAKGIDLVVGHDEELPDYLMGDPTRVKQIFYNLVGNALKFTETGEVVIHAKVIELTKTTARILFSVSDTGIGISKSRQQTVFQSFTQADMSTARKYGGTGLGLSICKELVELMQGSISVFSKPDKGSRFAFELPFQLADRPSAEAAPYNAELAGLRVLIIDDNTTHCELYRQMCAGWGYRSSLAADGLSGLSILEEAVREGDPYRLILLDQQMPGLGGLDLASLVRSRAHLRDIQIILLSSSLSLEESKRAKQIGVARVLAKPVKRTTLQEVILETFGVSGVCRRPAVGFPLTQGEKSAPLRVLLVEDNPVNQYLASRRLKKLGHDVTLASHGFEALEAVQKGCFDCILMDIQMPDMDGFEATSLIRSYEEEMNLSPQYIIAMTAHALKGDRERCLAAGMDNYISKPFRGEELRDLLNYVSENLGVSREAATVKCGGGHLEQRLKLMNVEDRDDVIAAAPMFLETCPKELLKLQNAVGRSDFKECYFIAHNLKGVAGIFRDEVCARLAGNLEAAAQAENAEFLKDAAEGLVEAIQALAKQVELVVIQ